MNTKKSHCYFQQQFHGCNNGNKFDIWHSFIQFVHLMENIENTCHSFVIKSSMQFLEQ
jgi:hypothetical protein